MVNRSGGAAQEVDWQLRNLVGTSTPARSGKTTEASSRMLIKKARQTRRESDKRVDYEEDEQQSSQGTQNAH